MRYTLVFQIKMFQIFFVYRNKFAFEIIFYKTWPCGAMISMYSEGL